MDPITLALIVGLGSGVLGGAVSQLIAGWFKTRGDTRQLNAAERALTIQQERWESEQEAARKQYLVEARRDAYVKFLHQADLIWVNWYNFSQAAPAAQAKLEDRISQGIERLSALGNELALYDVPLGRKARDLLRSEPRLSEITKATFESKVEPWNAVYRDLQALMRKSLGIEPIDARVHNQP